MEPVSYWSDLSKGHRVSWHCQASICLQTLFQSLVPGLDLYKLLHTWELTQDKITAYFCRMVCTASSTPCSTGDLDFTIPVPSSYPYSGRIRRAKESNNNAKYGKSPRQSKGCYSDAGSSVHQGHVIIQHTGPSHLGIAGTETILFPVEKLITFRRWWYAWQSFLPLSNRWTNCAVSVCSWHKIVPNSLGELPTALSLPWPVHPTGIAKGAFTCSFSQRVPIQGL